MATNKNQHFVPRCYLRSFTRDEAGRAINLFNIDQQLFIINAPVKHQCSGNYFYGKDLRLEKAIQTVEREYGKVANALLGHPRELSDYHQLVLKRFWLLQYLRTEAASKRAVEMLSGMGDYIASESAQFRMSIREAVHMAMLTYAETMEIVDDLKVCVLRNKTQAPFITSDDPAILTNRWHLQDKRASVGSFGLRSAGVQFLLPISPRILCMGYDGDVYTLRIKHGFVDVKDIWDVKALNEHQYLNCCANIFVRSKDDAQYVSECYSEVAEHRLPSKYIFQYAVLDESSQSNQGYERFVVVDPEKAGSHRRAIISGGAVHAHPSAWPRLLRWRVNGKVFTNGTGVGYVRHAYASGKSDFWKEQTRGRKRQLTANI